MTYRIEIMNYGGNTMPAYALPTKYSKIADARRRAIKEIDDPKPKGGRGYYFAKVYEINPFGGDIFKGEVHMHVFDGPRWYPASGPKYTSGKCKLNRDGTIRYRLE